MLTHNIWFVMSHTLDSAREAAAWYAYIMAGVTVWALIALGSTGLLYIAIEARVDTAFGSASCYQPPIASRPSTLMVCAALLF